VDDPAKEVESVDGGPSQRRVASSRGHSGQVRRLEVERAMRPYAVVGR